ncbi:hypothetical protein BH23BAC1_BH23BAC1_49880 [soil metagenome]
MTRKSTRRKFLTATGLGVAGLSLNPFTRAEASNVNYIKEPKGVELAIATITMDGFGDKNFEPAFELLPQLPFKNVEFNCWYARNLTLEGLQSIKDRSSKINVTPVCVQGTSFGASGNIIKDVTHKIWNMEAARRLGCRRVKFTGSGRGSEGGLEAVIEVLKEITPVAEEWDMLILVENHANNNLENIEDYEKIFSDIKSPHVGMCMDNAHFDGANVDLMKVVDRFHERILHIDLKDTERMGIHKVVNYGKGVTKNDAVVEKMLDHGYKGYLLIEMAPPQNEATLKEDLTRAYNLFKKYEQS